MNYQALSEILLAPLGLAGFLAVAWLAYRITCPHDFS